MFGVLQPISIFMCIVLLLSDSIVNCNMSEFEKFKGKLIFQEEFNTLNKSRWQHIVTAWRGGNNEFEYYTDRPENR